MKRLFLIYGDPGSGKSTLARQLGDEYSYELLSLDDLYVWFIEKSCPMLYFDALDKFIALHYQCILVYARENIVYHFGRDYATEWHEHLLATISELSEQHNDLLVEGYLLYDCLDLVRTQLSQASQVHLIHVKDRIYLVGNEPITVGEIAELGRNDSNAA